MSNISTLSQPLIPVNTSVDAVVDGSTYTYTVRGPGQGQAMSVTISVPGAPQASQWSVTGAWTGSMQGSNSFGPLYLTAGGSLTVTGSSVSDPGPLQVTGVQGPLGSLQPSTPTSVGPSVEVGTVDATITGTVDANVTNATLDVTGTVVVSQVTEVTGTVTIDANGSNVTVDEMPIGTLVATIPVGSSSYTLDAATVGKNNSLTILGTTNDLRSIAGIQQSAAPNYLLPMGQAIGPEGATEILAVVCDIPANMGVQIEFVGTTSADVLVYGSTGIDYVAATIVNLPLTLIGWGGNVPAVQVAPSLPVMTVSVPEPAAGADWSYTLPYPAKVTAVVAELVSASGGSNPVLTVGLIGLYWETGTLAAGTYYLKAWPGPPALAVVSQFGNILLAIPDLGVLPSGTVISGAGQASGDQWSNISLVLEPA